MVSCEKPGPYRARARARRVRRPQPERAGRQAARASTARSTARIEGRHQPIHNGSYVFVPAAPQLAWKDGFTVQAMIWPTTPRLREQVLLSCWSAERGAGFELIIDAGGAAALRLGDGKGGVETVSAGQPLLERVWCFVCASFDPATRRVSVHQRRQVAYARLETTASAERTVALRAGRGRGAALDGRASRRHRRPRAAHGPRRTTTAVSTARACRVALCRSTRRWRCTSARCRSACGRA